MTTANTRPMTLATLTVSCWVGLSRSIRLVIAPCTVWGMRRSSTSATSEASSTRPPTTRTSPASRSALVSSSVNSGLPSALLLDQPGQGVGDRGAPRRWPTRSLTASEESRSSTSRSRSGRPQQPPVGGPAEVVGERPGVARGAGGHHQQQRQVLPAEGQHQPGRGRVQPVGVLDHQHRRGLPDRRPQQPDQQVPGAAGAALPAQLGAGGGLGQLQAQHRVEQRGQVAVLGVRAEQLEHQAPAVRPVGAVEGGQPAEQLPPGVPGGVALDRVPGPGQHRHPGGHGLVDQLGDQARLAGPGLALQDQHLTGPAVAAGGQPAQGARPAGPARPPARPAGPWPPAPAPGRAARPRAPRPVDRHRVGPALDPHRREGLEGQGGAGRLGGGGVAEHALARLLHQPGGQVHHPAQHGVLAPPAAPDRAAEGAAGGHPDRDPAAAGGQGLAHGQGGLDAPGRVVLVGQGRQPERRHQGGALLVDAELVDAALVAVQGALEGHHHLLGLVQAGPVVQVGQVGEHHRDLAQLGQPLLVAGDHRGQHRPGQVGGDQRGAGRGRRRRPGGGRRRRLAAEVVLQQVHGRPGEHHLPGPGPLGGAGRLRHRRPGDQQLPPLPLAPDVQHHHLAGPDPDAQGQGQPLGRPRTAQRRLHGLGAAGRHRRGRGQPPPVEVPGRRRPAGQQRVPGELEHVPAGPGDQLQQRLERPVEQPPQLLGPTRPPLGQPLGDGREPGDVGQQQRPRHPVGMRPTGPLRRLGQPPHQPPGRKLASASASAATAISSPSSRRPRPAARQQVSPAGWRTTSKWAWRKGVPTP